MNDETLTPTEFVYAGRRARSAQVYHCFYRVKDGVMSEASEFYKLKGKHRNGLIVGWSYIAPARENSLRLDFKPQSSFPVGEAILKEWMIADEAVAALLVYNRASKKMPNFDQCTLDDFRRVMVKLSPVERLALKVTILRELGL